MAGGPSWPGVEVAGIHEFVGNALIMDGETKRTTDLRGEPMKKAGEDEAGKEAGTDD